MEDGERAAIAAAWKAKVPPEAKLLLIALADGRSFAEAVSATGLQPRAARWIRDALVRDGYLDERHRVVVELPRRRPECANDVPIPDRIRQLVLYRDGHRCQKCGSNEEPTVDHKRPRIMGGDNSPDNLEVLCGSCNRRKQADAA